MITKEMLVGCEGLPPVIGDRLDRPWRFIGEVSGLRNQPMKCVCMSCLRRKRGLNVYSSQPSTVELAVTMDPYLFVSDDMLEVMVYFGVCKECDSVYWARQGPPYGRERGAKLGVL